MTSKRPILNFDRIKTLKLYPLVFALGAIVFSLYWAYDSGTGMGLGDIIFRFIAAIGISMNFGMSCWEIYADSKKSLQRKAKDEQIDKDLEDLREHKKTTTVFMADLTAKVADLQTELDSTAAELAKVKLMLANREPSVPQPV